MAGYGALGAGAGGGALAINGLAIDAMKDVAVNSWTPEEQRAWGIQQGGEANALNTLIALGALSGAGLGAHMTNPQRIVPVNVVDWEGQRRTPMLRGRVK